MNNMENLFLLFAYLTVFNALLCIGCMAELIFNYFFNNGE